MRPFSLLLGGLLAGCAASSVPTGGIQFDGEYIGQSVLVRGSGYQCEPANETLSVAVHNSRFDYPFPVNVGRTAPVPVQVAADGSVAGQMLYGTSDYVIRPLSRNAWVIVQGRIADGILDATITDDRCTHRLTARRS